MHLQFIELYLQLSKLSKADLPGRNLFLCLPDEVDEAGEVYHKLQAHRQECVEVEDVGKRAFL